MTLLTMKERIDLREKLRSLYSVCNEISDDEINLSERQIKFLSMYYETHQMSQNAVVQYIQIHIFQIVCNTRKEIGTLCSSIFNLTTYTKEDENEE